MEPSMSSQSVGWKSAGKWCIISYELYPWGVGTALLSLGQKGVLNFLLFYFEFCCLACGSLMT